MKYNKLGSSALNVSEICLGSMTWGEQNSESEAHRQLDYAVSRGVNFIDVAEMYPVPPRAETQGLTANLPVFGNTFYDPAQERATAPIAEQLKAFAAFVKAGSRKGLTGLRFLSIIRGFVRRGSRAVKGIRL